MKIEDIEAVKALELKCLNTSLGDDMLKDLILNPMLRGYVEEIDGKIVGYLSLSYDGDIIEIYNLCVDENYRRRHIASCLLNHAFQTLDAKSSLLEVRESNKGAIALYEGLGYYEIHRRKKYYQNEDAIVLKKSLGDFDGKDQRNAYA